MTLNEDRKQTKYGHKRWEHMTHTRQRTDITPPPERLVPSLNSSIGEGGWAGALEARPLRTNTDRNTGRGPPEWNRQTGTMAELGALEAMAVQGAQEAMADGLRGPWPRSPRPGPYNRNSYYPPQNFPGEVRGYQEPSRAKQTRQYKTRQERPPGPDRQDRTAHRNQKPSWAGLEAEASSGHDQESEALTGSLSDRVHIYDRGADG